MINNKLNLNELKLFSGLYNTIWLNDDLYEELESTQSNFYIDTIEYLNNIGELYCEYFKKHFNTPCHVHSVLGQKIILQFDTPLDEILKFIKNINTYDFELYNIYQDLNGHELFYELIQEETLVNLID